ncbi:MAG: tRNA pseudouridine(38-40) synthase TruA [Bacteroidales bacterium]|jgi:tRNA pseudouridine38-40 synthase|nr:tRNA pseudouridine(38-40) synthase TruA [Bacteroidales bacterium]HHT51569.1 tRNA pseudouridine(38-40) synthase TruA [Bacteroidales bacterium]
MRYFIQLSYKGAPFVGWQIQPNGVSVQALLEEGLQIMLKEPISLVGCGRTDAGVNAYRFFAHFDTDLTIDDQNYPFLISKLNSWLPSEIAIARIFPVPDDLHARFSAIERTYCYYVDTQKDPFTTDRAYRVYKQLDLGKMNQAAQLLLQTDDFTSFSKLHTQVNNNLCSVTYAQWEQIENQLLFRITANRFLRNMVRSIVGTLLMVGEGKIDLEQFQEIIDAKDRSKAGKSVPGHALFLENVRYDMI